MEGSSPKSKQTFGVRSPQLPLPRQVSDTVLEVAVADPARRGHFWPHAVKRPPRSCGLSSRAVLSEDHCDCQLWQPAAVL